MFLRSARAAVAAGAVLAALALPGVAAAGGQPPSPGAAGIGDRLYPTLGNGGYDVWHYDVAWRYPVAAPTTPVTGTVTIDAKATQSLSSFNLDWAGTSYGAVAVNGRPAAVVQDGEDIVITPEQPIHKGSKFRVVVAQYTATPTVVDPEVDSSAAFFSTPDGTATAAQPNFAHLFLPVQRPPARQGDVHVPPRRPRRGDRCRQRRSRVKTTPEPGRTVWNYDLRQPMATELVQIAAGDYDVTQRGVVDGVAVRDVTPKRLTAQLDPALSTVTAHIPWMQARVGQLPVRPVRVARRGRHPVRAGDADAVDATALTWFTELPQGVWEPTMVHELAHQWFGDSVAPYEWSDLWLNEGHATWYEILYAEEHGQLAEDSAGRITEEGYADVESWMRAAYAAGDNYRAQYGPVAVPPDGTPSGLFNPNVYDGGALVLYALRQEIGDGRVRRARARVGDAVRERRGEHGRLHRPGVEGRGPRPRRVPARVALRRDHAADAGAPGLDGRPRRRRRSRCRRRRAVRASPAPRSRGAAGRAGSDCAPRAAGSGAAARPATARIDVPRELMHAWRA